MDSERDRSQIPSAAVIDATISAWRESGLQRWWPTAGYSMAPLIVNGDNVLLQFDFHDLRRGDIVVFRSDAMRSDGLIAHRIIRIRRDDRGGAILTKGDNCALADAPVTKQNILGRVLAIRHGDEYVDVDTPAWRRRAWLIASFSLVIYSVLKTGKQMTGWLRLPRTLPGSDGVLRIGQAASRALSRLLMNK